VVGGEVVEEAVPKMNAKVNLKHIEGMIPTTVLTVCVPTEPRRNPLRE
jgi:hypothetical protein